MRQPYVAKPELAVDVQNAPHASWAKCIESGHRSTLPLFHEGFFTFYQLLSCFGSAQADRIAGLKCSSPKPWRCSDVYKLASPKGTASAGKRSLLLQCPDAGVSKNQGPEYGLQKEVALL